MRLIALLVIAGLLSAGCGDKPAQAVPSPTNPQSAKPLHQPPVSMTPAQPGKASPPALKAGETSELAVAIEPKAEKVAAVAFHFMDNRIEVVGVCQFAERTVGCWNPAGTKDADLTAKIKKALEETPDTLSRLPQDPKKKHRLVVLKRITAFKDGLLRLVRIGDSPLRMVNLELGEPGPDAPRFDARLVAAEPSEKTTYARLLATEYVREQAQMEPKVGASGTVAGVKYTIQSIERYRPDMSKYEGMGVVEVPTWKLVLKTDGKSARSLTVNLHALSGKIPVAYVDSEGAPVSHEEYGKLMDDARKSADATFKFHNSYRQAVSAEGVTIKGGLVECLVGVSPEKITMLSLQGSYQKYIDLIGIPLDPK